MEVLVKITSKGQVTIPKKIRDLLGTDVVRFKVIEKQVILEPVRDVGGIFRKYVKKSISYKQEREIAWQKVADEYRDLS
jgi:AbrB family looped-hinge helix DNA binding protein